MAASGTKHLRLRLASEGSCLGKKPGSSTEMGEMGVSMDDRAYYERRLSEELARAENEVSPTLRALHRQWAGLYRERIAKLSSSPRVAA